ncbi:MAG: SOS response-associated peptidase [Bifidobacteriaceae bacterium]|jgi:putative SOS response-associated peptidase YedK|nr:SOS response-associated peptidase [Bifidobacteriaceae bacterium]
MCGRFVVSWDAATVAARFGATIVNPLPEKSWNISPTQQIQILLDGRDGKRRLASAFWSLIPAWGKTKPLEYPTFNARVESILDKPTYRDSAHAMRAIIPATGYYEWKDRTPHYFHTEGQLLLLAGLYSWWRADSNSPWELTATIITRDSEGAPAEIHPRMPVIVADSLVDEWLDPHVDGETVIPRVLTASSKESAKLEIYPVDTLRGDGPELIQPQPTPLQ